MTKDGLKLLVIGGYGTFGGRLVRLLAQDPRLTIVVAGRSLHKAESFVADCGGPARLKATALDRDGDIKRHLIELAPDYVIDASGPWQNYGDDAWRIANAAIAAGVHYLDLADSTDFVCGVSALDEAAIARNVAIISGLSTCPALTAAVVRELAADFDTVTSVTGGIAPSPYAGMGKSVVDAIAAYAGKPVTVLEDGADVQRHTFVSTRRLIIAPPGAVPLPPLIFSLVDVPDLKLLPEAACAPTSAWFGVATRPAPYHRVLRSLARGVKAGLFPSLRLISGFMRSFANHLGWGEHRGGMIVELRGHDRNGDPLLKSWHLLAEGNTGPNVPVLGAAAIVRAHLEGRPPAPGARPADRELELTDFAPLFEEFGIVTGQRTGPASATWPLFRKVLGEAWDDLPAEIRVLHGDRGDTRFAGEASVVRGTSLLSRVISRLFSLPGAAESVPVKVTIELRDGSERWERDFSGHQFSSALSRGKGRYEGLLCERFGPAKFAMALEWDGVRLKFLPRRWSLLGLPMPRFLAPSGDVYESVDDGRFRFSVEIRMPLAGHIVTYKGWLEPNKPRGQS